MIKNVKMPPSERVGEPDCRACPLLSKKMGKEMNRVKAKALRNKPFAAMTHIPDITAEGSQASLIVEVETADSIGTTHTQDQWKLFDAFAQQHGKDFWVIVPAAKPQAAIEINQMGFNAQVWVM